MLANERKRKFDISHHDEAESSDEELEDFLFGNKSTIKTTTPNSVADKEENPEEATGELLSFSISTKPSVFDGEEFVEEKDDSEKVIKIICIVVTNNILILNKCKF